jgi:hypothetical protein
MQLGALPASKANPTCLDLMDSYSRDQQHCFFHGSTSIYNQKFAPSIQTIEFDVLTSAIVI